MIKIGWGKDEIGLFDYTNETMVSFKIEDEVILINFDKKNDDETENIKITFDIKDKYYDEFNKFFNEIFSKYEKENLITDDNFCTFVSEQKLVNSISLKHNIQDNTSICIQKNVDKIDYKLVLNNTTEKQIIVNKNDEPRLFEIYRSFISSIQNIHSYKYEKEKQAFELYINNKLSYYNIEIKNNYDLLDAFLFSLYYRELDENPSREQIRESLDLIKYMISENQRLNNERQELYDSMLNKVENKSVTTLNTIPSKTRILRKDH